jgi:predicted metal-dependent HD superfamily phosphohydrolase
METDARFPLSASRLDSLRRQWEDLCGRGANADRILAELSARYGEPGRAYHNLSHVDWLLEEARRFQPAMESYDAVRWAIWYHDAIYDTHRGDNEARSAELAAHDLHRLGVGPDGIERVRAMILATQTHHADALPADGRLFLDLDLSILGSDQTVYERYARAIRQEYAWTPSPIYRRERKRVLERFLERERIFFTEAVFAMRESQARQNIGRELAGL